jgi:hypothetical protein
MMGQGQPSRRFAVGVAARGGVNARGSLSVAPGYLVCEFGQIAQRISGLESIRHRGDVVHAHTARLIPPWLNLILLIDDGENVCLVTAVLFERKAVMEAVCAAGFRVEVHGSWLFRGLEVRQIYWGAREPGKGAAAQLGPTSTERALTSWRYQSSLVVVALCVVLLLWALMGPGPAILAAAFGLVGTLLGVRQARRVRRGKPG